MPILDFSRPTIEAIRREQILIYMTEEMAKKISTFEPGTWGEIQNEYHQRAERIYPK